MKLFPPSALLKYGENNFSIAFWLQSFSFYKVGAMSSACKGLPSGFGFFGSFIAQEVVERGGHRRCGYCRSLDVKAQSGIFNGLCGGESEAAYLYVVLLEIGKILEQRRYA